MTSAPSLHLERLTAKYFIAAMLQAMAYEGGSSLTLLQNTWCNGDGGSNW